MNLFHSISNTLNPNPHSFLSNSPPKTQKTVAEERRISVSLKKVIIFNSLNVHSFIHCVLFNACSVFGNYGFKFCINHISDQ